MSGHNRPHRVGKVVKDLQKLHSNADWVNTVLLMEPDPSVLLPTTQGQLLEGCQKILSEQTKPSTWAREMDICLCLHFFWMVIYNLAIWQNPLKNKSQIESNFTWQFSHTLQLYRQLQTLVFSHRYPWNWEQKFRSGLGQAEDVCWCCGKDCLWWCYTLNVKLNLINATH